MRFRVLCPGLTGLVVLLGTSGAVWASSFDSCVASHRAAGGAGMVAEAAARQSCREKFPLTTQELAAIATARSGTSSSPGTGTGPGPGTTVAGTAPVVPASS